ncbi:MAG: hypothetical protein DCC49_10570 [Acidobacteria bacterium]|nr:MAG: hypothetical protein DCC49_10570 [Acidobacteriota bacterium]
MSDSGISTGSSDGSQPAEEPLPESSANGGEPSTGDKKFTAKRVLSGLISLAIVVWVFAVAIPKFASYGAMFEELKTVAFPGIALLILATLLNVVAYSSLWSASLPGLKLSQAVVMTQASAGVNNALPAGGPISMGLIWAMLRSWGFSTTRIVQATTVSGIGNALVKLAIPVLAVILLAIDRSVDKRVLGLAALGLVILAVLIVILILVVRSDSFARRIGRGLQRFVSALMKFFRRGPIEGWDDKASEIRSDTVELLTSRWKQISLASIASQLAFFVVLLVSLRVLGVNSHDVGFAEAFSAFAIVRLVTTIPITPGGVGITQLGLVGMLAAGTPEGTEPEIAAAVMVYTALTYLITFPLGIICYLVWRGERNWRKPIEEEAGSQQ